MLKLLYSLILTLCFSIGDVAASYEVAERYERTEVEREGAVQSLGYGVEFKKQVKSKDPEANYNIRPIEVEVPNQLMEQVSFRYCHSYLTSTIYLKSFLC